MRLSRWLRGAARHRWRMVADCECSSSPVATGFLPGNCTAATRSASLPHKTSKPSLPNATICPGGPLSRQPSAVARRMRTRCGPGKGECRHTADARADLPADQCGVCGPVDQRVGTFPVYGRKSPGSHPACGRWQAAQAGIAGCAAGPGSRYRSVAWLPAYCGRLPRQWGTLTDTGSGPVSRPSSICMMLTPDLRSPASRARSTGAAPRQRGSSEAWTLMQPNRGTGENRRWQDQPVGGDDQGIGLVRGKQPGSRISAKTGWFVQGQAMFPRDFGDGARPQPAAAPGGSVGLGENCSKLMGRGKQGAQMGGGESRRAGETEPERLIAMSAPGPGIGGRNALSSGADHERGWGSGGSRRRRRNQADFRCSLTSLPRMRCRLSGLR